MHNDLDCIRRIKDGDVHAFEELVKRYERPLLSFANRILKNASASEEIVQDVFFHVYRSINRIDETKNFSSYLFAGVKNGCISFMRKKKTYGTIFEDISFDGEQSLYDYLIQKEKGEKVRKALSQLPEKHKKPLELYYLKEKSYEEIGDILRIPLNTVRTYIRRGKETLKKLLLYET